MNIMMDVVNIVVMVFPFVLSLFFFVLALRKWKKVFWKIGASLPIFFIIYMMRKADWTSIYKVGAELFASSCIALVFILLLYLVRFLMKKFQKKPV